MSYRPDNRRHDPRRGRRRGRRGAGPGAGRPGVEVVAVDPAIITVEEVAAAAEFAARDAAEMDAEWAGLSDADREALACGEDEYDDDGHVIVPPDPFAPDATDDDATDSDGDSGDGRPGGDRDGEDPDGADRAPTTGVRWWEAQWLSLAADGAAGATVFELVAAATAEPGSLGTPDLPDQPGSSLHQLQCLDRLVAVLAGHRHGLVAALCPVQDEESAATYRYEQHLVDEIATATRVGPGTAARAIDTARLLTGPFRVSREDLPGPLVEFTKARDGQCAAPYCERPARRCQMDHRGSFPGVRLRCGTAATSATCTTPRRPRAGSTSPIPRPRVRSPTAPRGDNRSGPSRIGTCPTRDHPPARPNSTTPDHPARPTTIPTRRRRSSRRPCTCRGDLCSSSCVAAARSPPWGGRAFRYSCKITAMGGRAFRYNCKITAQACGPAWAIRGPGFRGLGSGGAPGAGGRCCKIAAQACGPTWVVRAPRLRGSGTCGGASSGCRCCKITAKGGASVPLQLQDHREGLRATGAVRVTGFRGPGPGGGASSGCRCCKITAKGGVRAFRDTGRSPRVAGAGLTVEGGQDQRAGGRSSSCTPAADQRDARVAASLPLATPRDRC